MTSPLVTEAELHFALMKHDIIPVGSAKLRSKWQRKANGKELSLRK